MIVTLRTVPRDDGRTSVVLTRNPGDPRDPEVVNVFPTSRGAVRWLIDMMERIEKQAGPRLLSKSLRLRALPWFPWQARARITLAVAPGEHVRLG